VIGHIREVKFLSFLSVFFLILQGLIGAAAVMWGQSDFILASHFGISLVSFASVFLLTLLIFRSEERRVGKECRSWVSLFISSRRRHTRSKRDWSSDVCSSDLVIGHIREVKFLSFLSVFFLILQGLIGAAAVMWGQSDFILASHFGISLVSFASVFLLTLLIF